MMQRRSILLLLLFVLSARYARAQATASASVGATIVTPVTIDKLEDLNFGNLAVSGSGTIVLTTTGIRQSTGGITLPAATGLPAAASFKVSGASSYTYAITLPQEVTISSGTSAMLINSFVSTPSVTGTLTAGSQMLHVGATLHVQNGQQPGTYISTEPFDVTVNYN